MNRLLFLKTALFTFFASLVSLRASDPKKMIATLNFRVSDGSVCFPYVLVCDHPPKRLGTDMLALIRKYRCLYPAGWIRVDVTVKGKVIGKSWVHSDHLDDDVHVEWAIGIALESAATRALFTDFTPPANDDKWLTHAC